jgi:hypothetical protein
VFIACGQCLCVQYCTSIDKRHTGKEGGQQHLPTSHQHTSLTTVLPGVLSLVFVRACLLRPLLPAFCATTILVCTCAGTTGCCTAFCHQAGCRSKVHSTPSWQGLQAYVCHLTDPRAGRQGRTATIFGQPRGAQSASNTRILARLILFSQRLKEVAWHLHRILDIFASCYMATLCWPVDTALLCLIGVGQPCACKASMRWLSVVECATASQTPCNVCNLLACLSYAVCSGCGKLSWSMHSSRVHMVHLADACVCVCVHVYIM